MLSHNDIRSHFLTIFQEGEPQSGVFLVARYLQNDLQLPEGRAHIFIPDCHLLTPDDAQQYPRYHFCLKDEFERFLRGLVKLKSDNRGDITVWQIGDLFDLWRALGNRGDQVELDAITSSYATAMGLLLSTPPYGLRAEIVTGNHDYALHTLPEWGKRRFALLENATGKGDILILHGDVFSGIEFLPIGLKEFGVRIARWISAGQYELDQEDQEIVAAVNRTLLHGDAPIGEDEAQLASLTGVADTAQSVNVIFPDKSGSSDERTQFFAGAKEVALSLKEHGHDVRAVVVAHTHYARMVAGDRGDGVPFVLMDCGAWFEKCKLSPNGPLLWSAQVGVIVGSELRIYQIGSRQAS